jgi:hypothetical protein
MCAAASVKAAPVTYTLVPDESGLGLTGTVGDAILTGVDRFYTPGATGTVQADRGGNTVNFTAGSTTAANRGSISPGPAGGSAAPANFGFAAEPTVGPLTQSVQGAVRDLKFHFVSTGPTTIGADGKIATDSFDIVIDSGTYSYRRDDGQFDDVDLSGTRANESNQQPTFSSNGGSEYLVVPFQFTVVTSTLTTNDTFLTFTGGVEGPAGAAVPEPTGLFALAGAGMFLGGRRRR